MSRITTFDEFYAEYVSKFSDRQITIDSDGLRIIVDGVMDGRVSTSEAGKLLTGGTLLDLAVASIYDVDMSIFGQCHMYCKKIDECNLLKATAVVVRLSVRGSTTDEYLCMSCNDRGLVVPTHKAGLLKDIAVECIDRPAAKAGLDGKQAYEVNKFRDTCVLCGQPTVEKAVMVSTINYCPCVEDKIS